MNYRLMVYGEEGEFVAKKLTKEDYERIQNHLTEKNLCLVESRYDLFDDPWDGDLFRITKALDNDKLHFELLNEHGVTIGDFFGTKEISTIEEWDENFDDYVYMNVIPEPGEIIYFSVDRAKGGFVYFDFESDEVPQPKDFSVSYGVVEESDGDWDYVNKYYFKGKELEITDYIDSRGDDSVAVIYIGE
jgi:hypothetical protein